MRFIKDCPSSQVIANSAKKLEATNSRRSPDFKRRLWVLDGDDSPEICRGSSFPARIDSCSFQIWALRLDSSGSSALLCRLVSGGVILVVGKSRASFSSDECGYREVLTNRAIGGNVAKVES
jgi:hypothetical protein